MKESASRDRFTLQNYTLTILPLNIYQHPESPVTFYKFDTDDDEVIASRLNIGGLPSIMFMKDGVEVKRLEGAFPSEELVGEAERCFGLLDYK